MLFGEDKTAGAIGVDDKNEPKPKDVPQVGLREMNAMAGAFAAGADAHEDPDREDPHMLRYVEEEMRRRRGEDMDGPTPENEVANQNDETGQPGGPGRKDDDDVAERYLTGIVEVALPVEFKFKNIEDTERAKAELLRKQERNRNRNDHSQGGAQNAQNISTGAGGNFSSNFALHKKELAVAQKAGSNGHKNQNTTERGICNQSNDGKGKRDRAENVASDDYVFKRWMNNEKKRKH